MAAAGPQRRSWICSGDQNGGYKPGDFRNAAPSTRRAIGGSSCGTTQAKAVRYRPSSPPGSTEQWSQFRGRSDCVRALWRHVVQEVWLKGHPVPGFGTVEEWSKTTGRARPHPRWFAQANSPMGGASRPSAVRFPSARPRAPRCPEGIWRAHTHQPDQVLTDRSPLMPLQFVIMDDHRGDIKCLHFSGGRGEFVYPLFVGAVDACSAVDTAIVGKPRALKRAEQENDQEKSVREGVTQDMALLVVIQTLRTFGIPEGYPITFVHEKAAACAPSWRQASPS